MADNSDRDSATDEAARENLRLARRVARLELLLAQVEQIRDGNEQLLSRLMDDLEAERKRSRDLLLNVLPEAIVTRLDGGERDIADRHEFVAVLMSDLVGFTPSAAQLSAAELVRELNDLFKRFDAACAERGVEKIKTIGDAYMAVAGLASVGEDGRSQSVSAATNLALDMFDALAASRARWQMRIGIHVGPVVAGVIGTRKFAYDVWGDTVNVASRLESTSEPGRVHVSEAVAQLLHGHFSLERRGPIELKGKGVMDTWLVTGRA